MYSRFSVVFVVVRIAVDKIVNTAVCRVVFIVVFVVLHILVYGVVKRVEYIANFIVVLGIRSSTYSSI
jgi:hypothetical protein